MGRNSGEIFTEIGLFHETTRSSLSRVLEPLIEYLWVSNKGTYVQGDECGALDKGSHGRREKRTEQVDERVKGCKAASLI